jgi:hypothetical protein
VAVKRSDAILLWLGTTLACVGGIVGAAASDVGGTLVGLAILLVGAAIVVFVGETTKPRGPW